VGPSTSDNILSAYSDVTAAQPWPQLARLM